MKKQTDKQAAAKAAATAFPIPGRCGLILNRPNEDRAVLRQEGFVAGFMAGTKRERVRKRREDAKAAKPINRRVNLAHVEDLEYLLSFGGAMADRRRRIQAWLDGVIQQKEGRGR